MTSTKQHKSRATAALELAQRERSQRLGTEQDLAAAVDKARAADDQIRYVRTAIAERGESIRLAAEHQTARSERIAAARRIIATQLKALDAEMAETIAESVAVYADLQVPIEIPEHDERRFQRALREKEQELDKMRSETAEQRKDYDRLVERSVTLATIQSGSGCVPAWMLRDIRKLRGLTPRRALVADAGKESIELGEAEQIVYQIGVEALAWTLKQYGRDAIMNDPSDKLNVLRATVEPVVMADEAKSISPEVETPEEASAA